MRSEVLTIALAALFASAGAIFDIATRRIPNRLTYTGMLLALVLRGGLWGWRGVALGLAGGLTVGFIFILFYLIRAMGAGDVKLMAMVGFFLGPIQGLEALLACALFGGIMAVIYMVYLKRVRRTVGNLLSIVRYHYIFGVDAHPEVSLDNPESVRMPYGIAVAAGAIYAFCVVLLGR